MSKRKNRIKTIAPLDNNAGINFAPDCVDVNRVVIDFSKVANGYCIRDTKDKQAKASLADLIDKMSQHSAQELQLIPKTSFGSEKINLKSIKAPLPDYVTEDVTGLFSIRFGGTKHRLIGFYVSNVFTAVYVDYSLTVYSH